ncbi:MAG: uroporphyrinogen decarboxylase family protein [Terriglobia bacterium]|jgi:hypothetical protein
MVSSRERVKAALNHQQADRVPLDLGGCGTTGMHVDSVYLLRQALQLDPPGTPVKVIDPFQMLGEIAPDLVAALDADVLPLAKPVTDFGFRLEGWKPWTTFAGTPVLVPEGFNTEPEANGDILLYPQGDRSVAASGRMPKGGIYFDTIIRQPTVDDATLKVEDNLEEFGPIAERDLTYLREQAERLYNTTDKAILLSPGGTSFGSFAATPGPALKHPKGIRSVEEWQMSTITRRDHLIKIFERQCEIGLANLQQIADAVGNRVTAAITSYTDFGAQNGPFISPQTYRALYKPFNKAVNDWVHQHTTWKTFTHCCGSVRALLPDFVEAGFDILNPVQTSAAHMDPLELKQNFGDVFTFWGGGIDTQRTLPFGTPEQVREEVRQRIKVFGAGGGFVFNPVHNVQSRAPVENILAMYEAVREFSPYPKLRKPWE